MDDFILNWLNANKQNAWMAVPVLAFLEACPGVGLLVSGVILLTVSTVLYTEQIATLSQIVLILNERRRRVAVWKLYYFTHTTI